MICVVVIFCKPIYSKNVVSGNLLFPEGCKGIKWVKKSEMANLIPFEEMNQII